MNTFQKTIKYVAITFAILLTVGILTGIIGLTRVVISIFNDDNEESVMYDEEDLIDYSNTYSDVEQLDIINGIGKLIIKTGDEFRVEASNVSDKFRADVKNGTLRVYEEKDFLKFINIKKHSSKTIITIYVPDDFIAKKIKIESGTGNVDLENLSADKLIIDGGVGDIRGTNISAKTVEVDGGVGYIEFTEANFSDVDCDSGVGNITIEGNIFGDSEFDCGVGNVSLKIYGDREDYALRVDSGIGDIWLDGNKLSRDYQDNYKAENTLRINGGIGSVDIEFIQ